MRNSRAGRLVGRRARSVDRRPGMGLRPRCAPVTPAARAMAQRRHAAPRRGYRQERRRGSLSGVIGRASPGQDAQHACDRSTLKGRQE
eukprot:356661-Chlamydomonas_euryale.AAC.3